MRKSTHGGARPGSGRKPHKLKYMLEVEQLSNRAAKDLDLNYERLRELADGEAEVVEEEWAAAGTLAKKHEDSGFEHLDARELVLVRKKVTFPAPDRASLEYLTNRVMGRPPTQEELLTETQHHDGQYDLSRFTDEELATFRALWNKLLSPPDFELGRGAPQLGVLHRADSEL